MQNATFNTVIVCVSARINTLFSMHTRTMNCFFLVVLFFVSLHFSEERTTTETTWKFCNTLFLECEKDCCHLYWWIVFANRVRVWIYVMIKTNFYMDEFEFTFNIHGQIHISEWMSICTRCVSIFHYYRNSMPLTGVFEFIEKSACVYVCAQCAFTICINLIKWCMPMRAYFTFYQYKIEK